MYNYEYFHECAYYALKINFVYLRTYLIRKQGRLSTNAVAPNEKVENDLLFSCCQFWKVKTDAFTYFSMATKK